MNLLFKDSILAEEVNELRKSIGFRRLHLDQITLSLQGSKKVIGVYDGHVNVAMARLIFDGGSVALILDLIVKPEYENLNIEKTMIDKMLDYLKDQLKPGFGIQIDIKAWNKQVEIYKDLGFQISKVENRGHAMHYCISMDIEITDKKYDQMNYKP